jgi:hypothetical protein
LPSGLLSKNVEIKTYKTIIFPVALYGCETRSLVLREEHRLGVCENRVLWRIFGPKRDEIIGGWGKLHNKELHNLCLSPNTITMIKTRWMIWVRHVARRSAYRVVVGLPEGRKPLKCPKRT